MQIFRLIYGSILRVRTRIGRPENADRKGGKEIPAYINMSKETGDGDSGGGGVSSGGDGGCGGGWEGGWSCEECWRTRLAAWLHQSAVQ